MKNNHSWGLPLTAMPVSLRPLVAMQKIQTADTPPRIDASLKARLKQYHPEEDTTEMTALIAFQTLPVRFNAVLAIPVRGLCDNQRLPDA